MKCMRKRQIDANDQAGRPAVGSNGRTEIEVRCERVDETLIGNVAQARAWEMKVPVESDPKGENHQKKDACRKTCEEEKKTRFGQKSLYKKKWFGRKQKPDGAKKRKWFGQRNFCFKGYPKLWFLRIFTFPGYIPSRQKIRQERRAKHGEPC